MIWSQGWAGRQRTVGRRGYAGPWVGSATPGLLNGAIRLVCRYAGELRPPRLTSAHSPPPSPIVLLSSCRVDPSQRSRNCGWLVLLCPVNPPPPPRPPLLHTVGKTFFLSSPTSHNALLLGNQLLYPPTSFSHAGNLFEAQKPGRPEPRRTFEKEWGKKVNQLAAQFTSQIKHSIVFVSLSFDVTLPAILQKKREKGEKKNAFIYSTFQYPTALRPLFVRTCEWLPPAPGGRTHNLPFRITARDAYRTGRSSSSSPSFSNFHL